MFPPSGRRTEDVRGLKHLVVKRGRDLLRAAGHADCPNLRPQGGFFAAEKHDQPNLLFDPLHEDESWINKIYSHQGSHR